MPERPLSELKKGEKAEIIGFDCRSLCICKRLCGLGLSQGKIIRKISEIKMGGPVILQVDRAQIAIGNGMAKKIIVRKISD
ncbi:MAG: FeoA family protein [Proteobacteria bacterium]|nr:FeoA family protein [Pseudomonadota bacterium]